MAFARELLVALIALVALVSNIRSCTVDETCSYNNPVKHKQNASVGEYTTYITRKKVCELLAFKANKQLIDTIGDISTGRAQFIYTPNIIQNQPYPTRQAIIYNTSCPAGQNAYFDLLELDLERDDCDDYITVNLPSPHHIFGNNMTRSGTPVIGNISHVLFRSDRTNRNGGTGFKGYLQCFNMSSANMEGCTGGVKRRNVKSYLPGGRDQGDMRMLRKAAFDAIVSKPQKNFTDEDLELALKHENSCNAVLQALARAVIDYTDKHRPGHVSSLRPATPPPPPSGKIIKPPTTSAGHCVSTASNFPECARIGYPSTFLPNFEQESDNVTAIRSHMSLFSDLIYKTQCSNATFHLVCLVYAPVCITNQTRYKVCRELCEYVKSGCETHYFNNSYSLPPILNCDNDDIYSSNPDDIRICPDLSALQIMDENAMVTEAPATESAVTVKDKQARPPDDDEVYCVPMTDELPFCYNMTWANVSFPNWKKQRSLSEAAEEIQEFDYEAIVATKCHAHIRHLVCAYYAPVCTNVNRVSLLPCKMWCERIAKKCLPFIEARGGLEIPEFLHCSVLPEQPCFYVDN